MYGSRSRGSEIGEIFVREFVIGLGFVSGLFWRVGVDPEAVVFSALLDIYRQLAPDTRWSWYFWIAPFVITTTSWVGAYILGGGLGLLAVILALAGGFLYDSILGWILVIIAVVVGAFAVRSQSSTRYYAYV